MGEGTTEIKRKIIEWFPKLADDKEFEITSAQTPAYNCIAWAYNINDRWMWPNTGEFEFLDGVHYWPSDEIKNCHVGNFIEAFRLKGYECCTTSDFEEGYRKIALYVAPGTEDCTHAARQKANGYWTSKLGRFHDIQHENPQTIEGRNYGEVYCYMRRVFE
ncbi:MAG: hypothetical protein ACK5LR_02840 [Mangrovibacterium sp.]